jgi:hypothetical protein
MYRFTIIGVMVALLALCAIGQEAITLKSAIPPVGQRVKMTVEGKNTTKTTFIIMGNVQNKKEVKTKSLIYVDEVLENPSNSSTPAKMKRTYEKAVIGKDGNTTKLPIEAKTVLIEKKGDKYVFTVDGETLTGESLKMLESEFNKVDTMDSQDFFLPKKPVKPGDTWKVDVADVVKSAGDSGLILDKEKATANATLTKAYKKDQAQFGIVDFKFEAPITSHRQKSPLIIQEGQTTLKAVVDCCLDGSSATGTRVANAKFKILGVAMGIDVQIESEGTETKTVEQLKK